MRIKPGVFGLRDKHQDDVLASVDEDAAPHPDGDDAADQRVRVPLFPVYTELRHLLRVWPGRPRKQVTGLRSTIGDLRGTPQKTVDWTEPATWIPERLEGDDRELAEAIWTASNGTVNPRHTYGHWLLAQKYEFVEDGPDGNLVLTASGRDFLENPSGDTEVALDEAEGLVKLLSIVADNGPARAGGLLEDWSEYLKRRSPFGTDSTFKDTLRRRLSGLGGLGAGDPVADSAIGIRCGSTPMAEQPPRARARRAAQQHVLGDAGWPRLPPAGRRRGLGRRR